jgi:molecular chaperone DnaK
MHRATIDFGIDLGTTNSCIALQQGAEVEIIRNNEGFEYTPSAVAVDRKGRLHVGRRAKEQVEADPDNAAIEFKLQMGTAVEKVFQRFGQRFRPEELSAEVLKALVGDVRQRTGEEVRAAVITVPAAFEMPQCEATRKAAELAGLTFSPLLQEPVAAALAYGFQGNSDRALWLVYDLGGGTFDAAVIQMRDGMFRVVNHGGDNHLGGKLLDWAIVDELLVPAVGRVYDLTDFRRGNPRWRAAFAKLKWAAEQAKIRVSRDASAEICVEFPGEHGETIQLDYDLKKEEVERLLEPVVLRSLNICKKVLAEKNLTADKIEKVVLVGGPTLTPYLRQRLTDPQDGLGIPLDFRLDPMTVVARGAALFAGTQRLESPGPAAIQSGQYALELEYRPVGSDPEPLVGGKVVAQAGEDLSGFTIEFVDAGARPPRRSGKIALSAAGAFMTTLWATAGRATVFDIELCDAAGRKRETVPDRLTYTLGIETSDLPLIHSLGVAMANNEMDVLIAKGTPLPTRKRVVHKLARPLRRGQAGDLIRIPVVEGENQRRADRNRLIGNLEIAAAQLKRDVPAGSEIEISIAIDASRLLTTRAYIPLLDEEFEGVIKFAKTAPDLAVLERAVAREKDRLTEVRVKALTIEDVRAQEALEWIDREQMVHDVEAALAAAQGDRDAADKCQNRLLDLKGAIDEVEDALEWPALVAEAEQELESLREIVREYGTGADRTRTAALERETRQTIQNRDPELLRRKVKEVSGLRFRILCEQPGFWIGWLRRIEEQRDGLSNPVLADQLIDRANAAIDKDDVPGLKAAVRQLVGLLPDDQQQELAGYGGTTLR